MVSEKEARKHMNANFEYHVANCAFCGKGVLLASLIGRVVTLPNGWSAHKGCYDEYKAKSKR